MNKSVIYNLFAVFIVGLALSGCFGNDDVPFVDPNEQLQIDVGLIDQYLDDNGIVAIEHPSGLRYVVNNGGCGDNPGLAERISVAYDGRILGGALFDSRDSTDFVLNTLIAGWQIGLPLVNKGSDVTLYIPSGYGYGALGNGPIPPNSNLAFDIFLFEDERDFEDQLAYDVKFIDEYLASEGIEALEDSSGIRYTVLEEGTGPQPLVSDSVTMSYTGTSMCNGAEFDAGDDVKLLLDDQIEGIKLGLPLIKEGSKVTLYIPSVYGFGLTGSSTVGSNANLIYDIDLLEVSD